MVLKASRVLPLAALFATACVHDPPTSLRTLASGQVLEVVSMGIVEGDNPRWVLEYRTRLPINDRLSLQCEALAVWNDVRTDADSSGATRAGLWPNNFGRELKFDGWTPVILSHKSTAFSLEKNDHGEWVRTGGWESANCP
jgi:hypothetical protein